MKKDYLLLYSHFNKYFKEQHKNRLQKKHHFFNVFTLFQYIY